MLPLTPVDVVQSAIENKWINGQAPVAMALTVLGFGGSVYEEKYFERAVNPFKAALAEYEKINKDPMLTKEDKEDLLDDMKDNNPLLKDDVRTTIKSKLEQINDSKKRVKKWESKGIDQATIDKEKAEMEAKKRALMKYIKEVRQ
jgi:hypothetical protein